jgi:hypothetical protein
MSRIRTIKPEFWTSEQIVECSTTARLLFIGMWNFADDAGNMPASLKTLKMQIFPGDDFNLAEIGGWVSELVNNKLVIVYSVEGKEFWHITGWKHQKIERPSYKHPAFDEEKIVERSSNGSRTVVARHPPEGSLRESSLRESISPSLRSGDSAKKNSKGTTLSEDWNPPDELFAYGHENGLTHAQTADAIERYRLWALSNENRAVARKSNWLRAFQGFIRSEASKLKSRPPPRRGGGVATLFAETLDRIAKDELEPAQIGNSKTTRLLPLDAGLDGGTNGADDGGFSRPDVEILVGSSIRRM